MILKQIDIDIYYDIENNNIKQYMTQHNCTESEAIEFDVKLTKNLYDKFRYCIRSVCSLYSRLLPEVDLDCWKIQFLCVQDSKMLREPENIDGVYQMYVKYDDFVGLLMLSEIEKKKASLEFIDHCISDLLKYTKWDSNPFDYTHDMVVKSNYDNSYILGESVHQTTGYKAELFCENLTCILHLYVIIKDKMGNVVEKVRLLSKLPDDDEHIVDFSGELTWENETVIRVKRKSSDKDYIVCVNNYD